MSASPTRARFPRSVYGAGDEPDPRFSLANERTFLAWIRTALAFLAAGVALEALDLPIAPGLRLAGALVLTFLGVITPVLSWVRWGALERALRQGRPLPSSLLGPVLAVGTAVAGALVLAGIAFR
jgi:putative membrane protein